jgi:NADPH:quinone reductase-like Zn-dependent oxidoreductase
MITARKWVAVDFGGPETLRNIEIDVPDPGPGQITIAVRAAGMNPADAKHIAPGQDPAADGYVFIGASNPASGPFRARARSRVLKLAEDGDLVVPMAETFGFAEAPAAFAVLTSAHPPGKIALVNEP